MNTKVWQFGIICACSAEWLVNHFRKEVGNALATSRLGQGKTEKEMESQVILFRNMIKDNTRWETKMSGVEPHESIPFWGLVGEIASYYYVAEENSPIARFVGLMSEMEKRYAVIETLAKLGIKNPNLN